MNRLGPRFWQIQPSPWISIGIFVVMTGLMAYLRLYLFHDRFITLTYGLPLLICLLYRDRRLLWSMAGAFMLMSWYKAFYVLPDVDPSDGWEKLQWSFQMINTLVIGGAVHAILDLTDRLHAKNAALEDANAELQAQAEELSQQNEEIQQQSEELAEQGNELRQQIEESEQQNEELVQQGEELATQSEELQAVNAELNERETLLSSLLKTAALSRTDHLMLEEICTMALPLLGPSVQCVAVVERAGDELVLRAQAGLQTLETTRWAYDRSLASICVAHGRTACVRDLATRPDLVVPHAPGTAMRASIATPILIEGETLAVLEAHSMQPHSWTSREFQMLEWAAMQSGLVLQIHRLREGLEQRVAERTSRLKELVEELEHFSYSITHDLRAPLRAMQGFGSLLLKDAAGLSEEQNQYLRHIVESASRMDRLITDAFSYAKAVQTELRLNTVDTQRLCEGIVRSFPNLRASGAKVEIASPLPPVLANEAGLTQCVSNLLDNAVKFVPQGTRPEVTIRAEAADGHVKLLFEDNGIGIAPEFEPYLFQMFRRASRDYEGTGIGLALVKKTCERMGGQVGYCTEPGRGSQFWMLLKTPNHAETASDAAATEEQR